jgi:hypothetical protein
MGLIKILGVVDAILVHSWWVLFSVWLLRKMREEKERKSFEFCCFYLFFNNSIVGGGVFEPACLFWRTLGGANQLNHKPLGIFFFFFFCFLKNLRSGLFIN